MLAREFVNWRQHYDRMVRSYERLKGPYQSSVVFDDDVAHFLMDCWHLKDWIAADKTTRATEELLRAQLRQRPALRALQIVGDLANATKHCVRDCKKSAYVTSKSATVDLGTKTLTARPCVVTLTDGSNHDLMDVIRDAFQAWHVIIAELGLRLSGE